MESKQKPKLSSAEANAQALAEIIVDDSTPTLYQIEALNKLLESGQQPDFFLTMLELGVSMGRCPCCGHQNHWLIPEDRLNEMGYVSAEKDSRVKTSTTIDDCAIFREACAKKKVNA